VFDICLAMGESERKLAKFYIGRFLELMSDPSTRTNAYDILERETGISRNAFRVAFCKAGVTNRRNSCAYSLPPEVDKALEVVCLVHARQGIPLTKPDFLVLASKVAKKEDGQVFSSSFFKNFLRRHKDTLTKRRGKITSKTRCYDLMLQKTQDFVASMSELMATKIINKSNTFVFDETIIGNGGSLPIVIGERKESGGGTVNVLETRALPLGCYIPFSMPDGNTPFRVFIFRTGPNARGKAFVPAFEPNKDSRLRQQPVRVFLESEKGYLTIELFRYIMKEFTKWWTTTRPGLHCFLICDNLSAHKDHDIVSNARCNGIHFINIIPGSSHWFQVHDQQPFGLLKKDIRDQKNKNPTPISATTEVSKTISMTRFYEAEVMALEPSVVRKAFKSVGLTPWNPDLIFEACEKHSGVRSELMSSELMKATIDAIREIQQEKTAALVTMMSRLRPVEVKKVKVGKKRNSPNKDCSKIFDEEEDEGRASTSRKKKDMPIEPPKKRGRGRPRKQECST